jgi:hypothetical protein
MVSEGTSVTCRPDEDLSKQLALRLLNNSCYLA